MNITSPPTELKWLFFDLNSYFASVEQQENPELRGKPVAIVPAMTDSTCAIAASYEAKALGIKTGTKIYEAKKMCRNLICIQARHDVYTNYHYRIMEEVEKTLHISKICSIDEAACRLIGEERKPENAENLAIKIKNDLKNHIGPAITCSIGIAPNMFLAKTASDIQKPDGLVLIKPEDLPFPLFSLKLRDLPGINVNMEHRLNSAGIFSVEDFWNLSPKHARAAWRSVHGESFWYKLRGYDIPDKETKKTVIGHSRVLDPELRPPEKAWIIAAKLTRKAASRLRREKFYASEFSLSVKTAKNTLWADIRRFSSAQDDFTFLDCLHTMWCMMLVETEHINLKKISISLSGLNLPQETTLDLFEEKSPDVRKKKKTNNSLSNAIDSLNQRYGADTVQLGPPPKTKAGYVGTKIAFRRIPSLAEFSE